MLPANVSQTELVRCKGQPFKQPSISSFTSAPSAIGRDFPYWKCSLVENPAFWSIEVLSCWWGHVWNCTVLVLTCLDAMFCKSMWQWHAFFFCLVLFIRLLMENFLPLLNGTVHIYLKMETKNIPKTGMLQFSILSSTLPGKRQHSTNKSSNRWRITTQIDIWNNGYPLLGKGTVPPIVPD